MEISINTKEQLTLFDHRLRYLLKIYHFCFIEHLCTHNYMIRKYKHLILLHFFPVFIKQEKFTYLLN